MVRQQSCCLFVLTRPFGPASAMWALFYVVFGNFDIPESVISAQYSVVSSSPSYPFVQVAEKQIGRGNILQLTQFDFIPDAVYTVKDS